MGGPLSLQQVIPKISLPFGYLLPHHLGEVLVLEHNKSLPNKMGDIELWGSILLSTVLSRQLKQFIVDTLQLILDAWDFTLELLHGEFVTWPMIDPFDNTDGHSLHIIL